MNAKISNYRKGYFITAFGLDLDTGPGTSGHKAPEVIKGHSSGTYNKEVYLAITWSYLFHLPNNLYHCRLTCTPMASCCSV